MSHEFLMENMVATWSQVDVLVISGRLFAEHFDQEKIGCLIKIGQRGAIVLRQNHHWIDRFWKVLVMLLFPVGQVPILEYIFELQERPCIVQVNFCRSADEVVDCLIE